MEKVTLIRYYQDAQCTLGFLKIEGLEDPIFYTIEKPWKDNKNYVSCIPQGTYRCFIRQSPSNGEVYELIGVPNRTNCQIHKANFEREVVGCIAIGESAGYMKDTKSDGKIKRAVSSSSRAMNRFKELMKYEEFELAVIGGSNNWEK